MNAFIQATHMASTETIGALLRDWRARRRLSQMDLALDAGVSPRHLSCVETGKAQPSREMVARLADALDVPLRERNALLVAAGFAPVYAERALDDPALDAVRHTIELLLRGMEPYPALAVDRYWHLVTANRAAARLMAGLPETLTKPPVNVLRASLHPTGLAPRIRNLAQWRAHLLERLRHQVDASQDPQLMALLRELQSYPAPPLEDGYAVGAAGRIAVPMELDVGDAVLSMLSTTTVFGTPTDVMLQELAIEAFVPADEATATWLRRAAEA